jgi:hypothetical protein
MGEPARPNLKPVRPFQNGIREYPGTLELENQLFCTEFEFSDPQS